MKCSAGQRFAGPYSAPGQRMAIGRGVDSVRARLAAAHFGEQWPSRLAPITDTARNAGEPGDQRRLERIGQHEATRIAARPDLARERASLPESKFAMAERARDDLDDAAH